MFLYYSANFNLTIFAKIMNKPQNSAAFNDGFSALFHEPKRV